MTRFVVMPFADEIDSPFPVTALVKVMSWNVLSPSSFFPQFTDPTLEKFVPLKSLFRLFIIYVSFKYIYCSFPGYLLSSDIG